MYSEHVFLISTKLVFFSVLKKQKKSNSDCGGSPQETQSPPNCEAEPLCAMALNEETHTIKLGSKRSIYHMEEEPVYTWSTPEGLLPSPVTPAAAP